MAWRSSTALSLRKAGTGYTLVATAQGFAGATSTAFDVTPGPAASFTLTLPASVTAGQEATLSATAYDAYGNVATTYGGPVKVTSSDTAAVLPANATFAEGVLQGLKVTFKSPGLRTLTLTDAEKASLSGVGADQRHAVRAAHGGGDGSGGRHERLRRGQHHRHGRGGPGHHAGPALHPRGWGGDRHRHRGDADGAAGTAPRCAGGSAHTITAVIIDGAGNVATSAPVTVTTRRAAAAAAAPPPAPTPASTWACSSWRGTCSGGGARRSGRRPDD